MTDRRMLKRTVAKIMSDFDGEGNTADYVEFVKRHNGGLQAFEGLFLVIGLEKLVGEIIRSQRSPQYGNVRAFHSVETPTGDYDDEGNDILSRAYVSIQKVLFDKEPTLCDKVVNSYIRSAESDMREANKLVIQRRRFNNEYQRDLPFPDLEDDEQSKAG